MLKNKVLAVNTESSLEELLKFLETYYHEHASTVTPEEFMSVLRNKFKITPQEIDWESLEKKVNKE